MANLFRCGGGAAGGKQVYDLGTGTSFNIRNLFPEIDYNQLTADNFIVAITSITSENTGVVYYQNLNDYTGAGFEGLFVKTYVNGLLSVTVNAKGTLRTGNQSSQSVVRRTGDKIGYKVYMVVE